VGLQEGEPLWLVNFEALSEVAGDMTKDIHIRAVDPAKGHLAWNNSKPELGLRMVEVFDGRAVSLIAFRQAKLVLRYGVGEHFRFYPLR